MYLKRKLNGKLGFTLAEVLVAGFIMVIALIPITMMFDASLKGITVFERQSDSVTCAQKAVEEIRSIPFYEPHDESNQDQDWDIDDHFWGSRNPINDNPIPGQASPDWNAIPKVQFYNYNQLTGYESFRVDVQLAYLEDDLSVAQMADNWGPKAFGHDRPTNIDNTALHLVLVRVNVYWTVEESEDSYSVESIITDTEAIYNLGISHVHVHDSSDTPPNPPQIYNYDPDEDFAASHWSDPEANVNLTISGWGFDPVTVQAWLVRFGMEDTEITLTSKSEDTLVGYVNLYTGHNEGVEINPWRPRAAVGYWTVKIRQEEVTSAYLYDGFVVQYPKPFIDQYGNDDGNWPSNKTGLNNVTDAALKITGGPFVYGVANPTVRLVKTDDQNVYTTGTITSITGANNGYTVSPNCEIKATFDLTVVPAGEYYMQVTNTEPEVIGHVESDFDPDTDPVYTIVEARPIVDDVYVYGTDPHSHTAYNNVGNPWRLTIEGSLFNMTGTPPVEVWLCTGIGSGDVPSGNMLQGTVVQVYTYNTIIADFDLSALPTGNYKAYVKNLNNNLSGWTSGNPFNVTTFSANIDSFTPDTGYGFYENYYDIPSTIQGAGFSTATNVTITNGSVEYDCEYTINSDTEIAVNLNLIDCDNTASWEVRVYYASDHINKSFDIALGPAVILPANDSKYAVRIYREGWWFSNGWSNETTTQAARARRSRWWGTAYGTFEVKGMGFPINGQTTLSVWKGSWTQSGNYSTVTDRNNKIVQLTSSRWSMPNTSTGYGGISVQRVGDSYVDSYGSRWYLGDN